MKSSRVLRSKFSWWLKFFILPKQNWWGPKIWKWWSVPRTKKFKIGWTKFLHKSRCWHFCKKRSEEQFWFKVLIKSPSFLPLASVWYWSSFLVFSLFVCLFVGLSVKIVLHNSAEAFEKKGVNLWPEHQTTHSMKNLKQTKLDLKLIELQQQKKFIWDICRHRLASYDRSSTGSAGSAIKFAEQETTKSEKWFHSLVFLTFFLLCQKRGRKKERAGVSLPRIVSR